jgi:hypothetical protein
MSICIRAGSWFNERPFDEGEKWWREFRDRVLDEGKRTAILELGAGIYS